VASHSCCCDLGGDDEQSEEANTKKKPKTAKERYANLKKAVYVLKGAAGRLAKGNCSVRLAPTLVLLT